MHGDDIAPQVQTAFARFHSLLPDHSVPDLLILKLHLLIEEQLHQVLAERCKKPECLVKAKLSFAQKLALSEALCADEASDSVWLALRELNRIRNALSHELEPRAIPEAMRRMRELLGLTEETLRLLEPDLPEGEPAAFAYAAPVLFLKTLELVRVPRAAILKLASGSEPAP
jgi:hypothetical protein